MTRHITRLMKSIRVFGLINGAVVFYYYLAHRMVPAWKWKPRQVRISGISRPIWLRPGVSDWIVMERIFMDREYDPLSVPHDQSVDELVADLLADGRVPLIVDCGANVGLSSVWFSERFPHAAVLAVEPEPDNYEILKLNAVNFPNIVPQNAAISDTPSRVVLSNDMNTPWSWQTEEADGGGVAALTVAHLAALDERYSPVIVKIDIEGFETTLFRSNTGWVDATPLLIFEMHDWMSPWSGSGHAFLSILSRMKRDYLVRGENVFAYSHRALLKPRG